MANLNLSQFTEKTFVADADWTFVWDTAGLISKKVSRNNWLNSGELTTSAPVTISQTWAGTGSTQFTALKVNAATTTGSISTAKIVELQHNSLNRFSVQKDGVSTIGASDTAVPEVVLNLVNQYGTYGFRASNGRLGFMYNNNEVASIFNSGVIQATTFSVAGVQIARDADHTLALRNGTNAQTFNVYGTYTSGSAYARLAIACDTSGNATLTTQSTGTAGTLSINGVPVGLGKGGSAFNVAVGTNALAANTTGAYIVAVGNGALQGNTTGNSGTAVGASALAANTTGGFNSAFGLASLNQNSSGGFNTALGAYALESNSTGGNNVGIGYYSLRRNTTGSNNLAIGYIAGYYITGGATDNALANNSLFLGANTKANASNETNQIVIGYDATGLGSNTAVLGNASITTTALRGNVGIGTTAPSSKLDVAGTFRFGSNNGGLPGGTIYGGNLGTDPNFALKGAAGSGTNLYLQNSSTGNTDAVVRLCGNSEDLGALKLKTYQSGVIFETFAHNVEQRNGANGQTFSVYGTYPGAAWERFTITAPTSGNVLLGTYKGTGGIARGLEIQTDGVTRMTINSNGLTIGSLNIQPANSAIYNAVIIGFGTNTAYVGSPSDGVLRITNNGLNGFNRLQFGGEIASFPALKRVGTDFQVVVANTTAANNVAAGDADLTFIEDRYRRKGAGTPEGVVTAPIGAVYHNTTGGAGTSFYVKESGTGNTGWVGK